MPRYNFECPTCGWTGELRVEIKKADEEQKCRAGFCSGMMARVDEIHMPGLAKTEHYGALIGPRGSEKVTGVAAGKFGKEAPLRRKRGG